MPESRNYHVIVSERAKRMLAEHIRFLAQVNRTAASETKRKIMEAFHSLTQMPERFPFFEADYIPSNKYHKMVLEKRYLILYQIRDDTVFSDYILDCRQDYPWLIR